MDVSALSGVMPPAASVWFAAAVVPVLVAIRCGQLGLSARVLVLSQLVLSAWLVQSGVARLTGLATPSHAAAAGVLFAALVCLGTHRLEGISPRRWKRLVAVSLACVLAPLVAGSLPPEDPIARGAGWLSTLFAGALLFGGVLGLAPKIRRMGRPDLGQLAGGVLFAAPVIFAAAGLAERSQPGFEALAFLPASLFVGWVLSPSTSPMRRASPSIDPILIVESGIVIDANDSAYQLLGAPLGNLHALRHAIQGMADLRQMVVEPNRECGEFFIGDGASTRRCFEVRASRGEGTAEGMRLLTLQDATARRDSERRLFHQAHFDSLTGLANRRYFVSRAGEAIERSDPEAPGRIVLMCLDLDRFKEINDTYGHAAGDELLRIMAHRLRQQLRIDDCLEVPRRIAPPSIARLGGDEFAILLNDIESRADVERIADRVLKLVAEPVTLKGRKLWVAGSIGIAFYPADGATLEDLSCNADVALYHAKSERRSQYQFFDPSLTAATQRKAALDRQLRGAIEQGELSLHFQPKVTLEEERIEGAEALLRWQSAEHGPVPPKEFIPIAEEYGLIGSIGTWVIESACTQLGAWRDQGLPLVPLSVNVSPRQFREMDLLDVVSRSLDAHGIGPELLEIELTESAMLEEGDSAINSLEQLRQIGVRVSLDDFGTGYSALSYLSSVPLDMLKLDRKFIRDIHLDPAAEGVMTGVVAMAHSLGLGVVAEGVDCEEQLDCLKRAGCDLIQGFVFGPGVPAEEFAEMLEWGIWGKPTPDAPDLDEEQPEPVAAETPEAVETVDVAETNEGAETSEVAPPVEAEAPEAEDDALLPARADAPDAPEEADEDGQDAAEAAAEEEAPLPAPVCAASPNAGVDAEAVTQPRFVDVIDVAGAAAAEAASAEPADGDADLPAMKSAASAAEEVDEIEEASAAVEGGAEDVGEASEAAESQAEDAVPAAEEIEAAEAPPEAVEAVAEDAGAEPESVEAASEPAEPAEPAEVAEVADVAEAAPQASEAADAEPAVEAEAQAQAEDGESEEAAEVSEAAPEPVGEAAGDEPSTLATAPEEAGEGSQEDPASEAASRDEAEASAEPLAAAAPESDGPASDAEGPERRVLVVGQEDNELGLLALRLNRLDVPALYARDLEEAQLFALQERGRIGALVVDAGVEAQALKPLVTRLQDGDNAPALIFVGGDPAKALLDLRGNARVWALNDPIMDPDLCFLFTSALAPADEVPQRDWVRAPYDLMVRMEVGGRHQTGVLTSVSEAGCFVACTPAPEGSLIDLEFVLEDGTIEVVGKVLYTVGDESSEGAGVGLEFLGLTRDLEERLAASIAERGVRCLA